MVIGQLGKWNVKAKIAGGGTTGDVGTTSYYNIILFLKQLRLVL